MVGIGFLGSFFQSCHTSRDQKVYDINIQILNLKHKSHDRGFSIEGTYVIFDFMQCDCISHKNHSYSSNANMSIPLPHKLAKIDRITNHMIMTDNRRKNIVAALAAAGAAVATGTALLV